MDIQKFRDDTETIKQLREDFRKKYSWEAAEVKAKAKLCSDRVKEGVLAPLGIEYTEDIAFYIYLLEEHHQLVDTFLDMHSMTYIDADLNTGINTKTADTFTVHVLGNACISADIPICSYNKTLIIEGTGILTLKATEYMQPCIGSRTNTNLSYGRYSTSDLCLHQIIVDGVKVICESATDNFTIGCYGEEEVPVVVCKNGGELICPEVEGERVIIQYPTIPEGSTKLYTPYIYGIRKENMTDEDLLSADLKVIRSQLPAQFQDKVMFTSSVEHLQKALDLLHKFPFIDISAYFDTIKSQYARTASILGYYNNDLSAFRDEGHFELITGKAGYLYHFTDGFTDNTLDDLTGLNYDDAARTMIDYLQTTYVSCEYLDELCYELIPAYMHHFIPRERTHKEEVESYLQEHQTYNTVHLTEEFKHFYDKAMKRR